MEGYIYITTNLVNGKKYIGRKSSKEFLGNKYLGSGVHLRNAINKYGEENFKVELLEEVSSKEDLIPREMYWIAYYDAVQSDNYYNHSPGGYYEGFVPGEGNLINDPTIKSKMILSKTGKPWTPIKQKAMDLYYSTVDHSILSERAKQRCAKVISNSNAYALWIKHLSEAQIGRIHTQETKEKIRQANLGSILIHKGQIQKRVHQEDLQEYLDQGYTIGGLPRDRDYSGKKNPMYGLKGEDNPNYGRVSINDGIATRRKVHPDEVQSYLDKGWFLGWKFQQGSTTIESIGNEKDITE